MLSASVCIAIAYLMERVLSFRKPLEASNLLCQNYKKCFFYKLLQYMKSPGAIKQSKLCYPLWRILKVYLTNCTNYVEINWREWKQKSSVINFVLEFVTIVIEIFTFIILSNLQFSSSSVPLYVLNLFKFHRGLVKISNQPWNRINYLLTFQS
jgi:hypothetical protein